MTLQEAKDRIANYKAVAINTKNQYKDVKTVTFWLHDVPLDVFDELHKQYNSSSINQSGTTALFSICEFEACVITVWSMPCEIVTRSIELKPLQTA